MTADAQAIALPLVEALRVQLEKIDNATSSRFTFRAFLLDLGWNATFTDAEMEEVRDFLGVTATVDLLDSISEAIEDGDPDVVALIAQSVAAIIEIVERVNDWTSGNPGALPAPLDGSTNFWDVFPGDLLDKLVGVGIEENLGPTFDLLRLFGVAEIEDVVPGAPSRVPFRKVTLHWDRLGAMVTDPLGRVQETIGWDRSAVDLDHRLLLDTLEALFFAADFPARQDVPSDATLDRYYSAGNPARASVREIVVPLVFQPGSGFGDVAELGFKALPIPPAGQTGAAPEGLAISPVVRGAITPSGTAGDWELRVIGELVADDVFRLNLRPSGTSLDIDTAAASVSFGLAVQGRFDPPAILIGTEGSHRLEIDGVFLSAEARGSANAPEFLIRAGTGDGPDPPMLRFVFQAAEGDGFVTSLMGTDPQVIELGGNVSFSTIAGIGFSGTAGLQIQIPLHLSLGPIEFQSLTIGTGSTPDGGLALPLGLDVAADLGPLQAVVSGIGVELQLVPSDSGLLGNLDLDWDFKPPTGVGLSIDAGAVVGGGFLDIDPDRGEYAGILQLSILDMVTVTSIGVITTKFPDGSSGFSFLAIISVEFNPGIQLGFGFTLIGVGGLVGLNRSVDLDALAAGAASGSIDTILFPQDVVANATRIINDLRQFFPPENDVFLIGPMAKLGWGTPTLISLSLGVIIEIPGNVAIVGKLTVAIPDEKAALIIIQVAFVGAIEFDTKRVWFTAVLYDSRVIYMPLEGGMGVLAAFGDDPNFVVTVGGFHPSYNPPALPFPDISRIAINILNTPVAKVIVTAYFAVTSNTVQFGAAADVYFGVSIANIDGHLGFDALFQFSPFYFIISISASLSVKLFGAGLFSVRFRGSLEGTSPWHIEGTGSISLLFWDVDVDFSETWGDKEDTELPPISVAPILAAELEKVENWTASLGASNALLVSLRSAGTDADLVLHPLGTLAITQRAVPLGITLDKIGAQKPDDGDLFEVAVTTAGLERRGNLQESFATAQFQDLDDDEKLSASDFEKEDAGVELAASGSQTRTSYVTKRVVRYEQIIIDTLYRRFVLAIAVLFAGLFAHFLGGNAVTRADISMAAKDRRHLLDDKIVVNPTAYVVADAATNTVFAGAPAEGFTSRAAAQEFLKTQVAADPSVAGQAHILRGHEMQVAA